MSTVTIPKTQLAILVDKLGPGAPTRIGEIPVPDPASLKEGECLIEMDYSGVCHSDLGIKDKHYQLSALAKLPLVGGHEGVGRIIALSPQSVNSTFSVGQRVGIKWAAHTCLLCESCSEGREWGAYSICSF